MWDILELQRREKELVDSMQGILDAAEKEKRDLSTEEREQFDTAKDEVEEVRDRLGRINKVTELKKSLPKSNDRDESRGNNPEEADPEIGMSDNDLRNYRILRLIRAAAHRDWREAQFELEVSRSVAERLGEDPQGIYIPYDVLCDRNYFRPLETRAPVSVGLGGATGGGNLVATDLLAGSFIDMLRNRAMVMNLGAFSLTGLVGDVDIPRQIGGATADWIGENVDSTESEQIFNQVPLSPHTVSGRTSMTRKLLKQSSIDVEMLVRSDLVKTVALAIDYAALHGDSAVDTDQPDGLAVTTGIGSVAGGVNGLAPGWSHIVQLETEITQDNADVGRMAYLTNALVRGKLKQTEKATGTAQFVWNEKELNGYNAAVSNQVRSDLTKGTSVGVCSAIFFGNWGDLIIGMWGALDLLVDPFTGSNAGRTKVVVFQDVDVAVRHPESFSAMFDALTA